MSPLKCLWMMMSWPLSSPQDITRISVTSMVIVYPCLHVCLLVTSYIVVMSWLSTRERHVATSYRRENQTATESPEPAWARVTWSPGRHRSEKIFVRIQTVESSEWALAEMWEMFVKKCWNIMASVHKYGFRIPISSEQYPRWLLNFPVTAELDSSDSTLSRTKDSCQVWDSQMWWTTVFVRVRRWYLAPITIAIPIHTRH